MGDTMEEKIIFSVEDKMGIVNGSSINYLYSQHLKKYHKNMDDIKKKHAWKTEGSGAAFMGVHNPLAYYSSENVIANINGIAVVPNQSKMLYSISIDEFSGIFIKNPLDNSELEGLVTSNMDNGFFSVDYDERTEKIAVSVSEGHLEKHIAVMSIDRGGYNVLTEGESIDENPSWAKTDKNAIYYDSAGIAISSIGELGGLGTKSILKLDLNSGDIEEVVHINKHDCIKPIEDREGNLYFIKRPHDENYSKAASLKDVILMPYKFLKAIFGWMNLFTAKYTGDTLTSVGQNPAKTKQRTQEEIFIEGNLINAEKTLKENQSAGEKFPGVAPRSWELMKMSQSGEMKSIKKGVIDFDINSRGEIVYSNGKYLLKVGNNSSEKVIGKVNLVNKVRII
jgi:hypothetical protein